MSLITNRATISFAGSGDNTVVAAVSGKVINVYMIFFVVAGATNITIKDATGTGAMAFVANGAGFFSLPFAYEPWFKTGTNTAFIINSSNAVQVSGYIGYGTALL